MLESEMDEHLGYEAYERTSSTNARNGTKPKTLRSKYGEIPIDIPQDRKSSFEPKLVPKHQKNITEIESKIIAMYSEPPKNSYLYYTPFLCPLHGFLVLLVSTFWGTVQAKNQ